MEKGNCVKIKGERWKREIEQNLENNSKESHPFSHISKSPKLPVILVAAKNGLNEIVAQAGPKLSVREAPFNVFPVFTLVPWAFAIGC